MKTQQGWKEGTAELSLSLLALSVSQACMSNSETLYAYTK